MNAFTETTLPILQCLIFRWKGVRKGDLTDLLHIDAQGLKKSLDKLSATGWLTASSDEDPLITIPVPITHFLIAGITYVPPEIYTHN